MSHGLKQAGFRVLGAVDVDALAIETYKRNHNPQKIWEQDITTLAVADVMRALGLKKGDLDLLAGCPPCQGFSTLKTLNGRKAKRDPRNNLVFHFLRFARGLRPRAIMMENVPALATDHRMTKIRRALEQIGYKCAVKVLDAADYGVPQRRKRMILLAGRGAHIHHAPPDRRQRTVGDVLRRLPKPGRTGDELHDFPAKHAEHVRKLIEQIPKNGGSRIALGGSAQLDCHKKNDGFHDIYGRMRMEDVSPTITSGCINPSKGRFLHPYQSRAITLREAAMLQTFPRRYHFSLRKGKYGASEMIGNALPPRFVRRHAAAVAKHLRSAT